MVMRANLGIARMPLSPGLNGSITTTWSSLGAGVAVPAPANVALVLAGLGVVGWRLRGRAQSQIAA